ncbi:hypothetical protein QR680_014254 [Steinernema hermaphroditum]|uniref:G-protein coupled receptors family 1 profile domain-containing protein n=1 Tax=Steinernema hermaphroditum TaxID=289476 RepID=A0AA39M3X4_9BILA|nr:hypothetical protein QR680_014254 [Steinernema hermaphroditum]
MDGAVRQAVDGHLKSAQSGLNQLDFSVWWILEQTACDNHLNIDSFLMIALYVTSAFIFTIGAFGLFGNVNLIIATIRTLPAIKRSRCGLLIGILAVCDFICIVFEWQNATRLLLGVENFRESCFWAISPYLYVLNFQATQMLVIALDRVFAICAPIKYRILPFSMYITLCMIPGNVFTGTLFVLSIVNMNNEPIEACNPPLGYPPLVLEIWNRWILIMDGVTIVLYLLAVVVLYWRLISANSTGKNKVGR